MEITEEDIQAQYVEPEGVDLSAYFGKGTFGQSLAERKIELEDSSFHIQQDKEYFFNHGLHLWQQQRDSWLARGGNAPGGGTRARDIDIDLIIDRIFSSASKGRLPYSVPLPQMIDILVDLWEAEGLYD
ncbi:unnamed protein product [Heterosigma akashiwo]|mmetsp:Transcript_7880/g.11016  ORF Transcript_7880/g.11016 Transcript_7880/m.11016 type:complete len:129 (-) Transcript_7880:129-515(-)